MNTTDVDVSGIVIRITLKNFMCHDHLLVNFNRHINFICGKNGSGKSAILTALVIGLGGRSLDTSRGSNLKGLIKCGKTQASIEVTLMNRGPDAYKPEIFGDELTIVRNITNNHSQYKVSGYQGKHVQCKRNELDMILDRFRIQINNPFCVLNQEMAKSFIKTSNPKDLYKFFMKSTLLSNLEETLTHCQSVTIPSLKKVIREKEAELNFVNQDLDEIKRKHEKKKKMMELEQELERLNVEYSWSMVHCTRKELSKYKSRLDEVQNKINDLNKKIQDKDGTEIEIIEKKNKLTAELKALSDKKDDYRNHVLKIETDYNMAQKKYKDLRDDKKSHEKKIQDETKNLGELYDKLKSLDSENAEAAAKRNRIAAQKQEIELKINDLKTIINTNSNHKKNLLASLKKISDEVSACHSTLMLTTENINRSKRRIHELESNASELTCYADYMPKLVQEIDREHSKGRFQRKPVGPLGHYIKLNNAAKLPSGATFGPIIEQILGRSLLCGFAVHSFSDSEVMKSIFKRLNIQRTPEMVICQFTDKVHDVSAFKVRHPNFACMLDALDINDPVVANTIIDQREVECVLLVPSIEEACSIMEHANNVPANCQRAVTVESLFFPYPSYRCYHMTSSQTTSILQANKDSLIRNLKNEIKNFIAQEEERKVAYKSAKEEEMNIRKLVTEADSEISRIYKELTKEESKLLTLDDAEEFTTLDREILNDDVNFRKNHIDQEQKSLKKVESAIVEAKNELQKAKELKSTLDNKSCNYDKEIDEIQEDLNKLDIAYCELTGNFGKIKSKKRDEEVILEKIRSTISKLETDLSSKLELAEKCSSEVDQTSCRPVAELKDRLSAVTGEIAVIREFIGDGTFAEITADLQARLNKVETVRDIIMETEKELISMSENTARRQMRFESLKHSKSKNIKRNFSAFTKLRNYKEDVIFDHQGRKLNISVKTDAKGQSSTSVLSLSGGERSYSMVSLILALWQEMALPFYCLDEFDVFMDPLNRHIIIKLLLVHAKENRNQQFVFFTPNDFTVDTTDNDVGIFRMEDPRDDRLSQL